MQKEEVKITTEFIKLESILKFAGIVGSGGEAKCMILDGAVSVNGETCLMRGKKIRPGDVIRLPEIELSVT